MTVIISVKINDRIIMASDSVSTSGTGRIVILVKGLPSKRTAVSAPMSI
jgi:ATP-dependent protease HslVU (ClpYQ) peptidase subunit